MKKVALILAIMAAAVIASPANAAGLQSLSTPKLKREARKVGVSGGILCHTVGVGDACATPYMKNIVRELINRYFPAADDRAWAQCIAGRESHFNPAAASATNDHGVGQLNAPSHTWVDYTRIAWWTNKSPTGWASDPVYSVAVFARLSRSGANRGPWAGGAYHCPRYY